MKSQHLFRNTTLITRFARMGWSALAFLWAKLLGLCFGVSARQADAADAGTTSVYPDADDAAGQWAEAPHTIWSSVILFGSNKGRNGQKSLARGALAFALSLSLAVAGLNAQTNETMPTGSFIINMGVVPQTIGNGLKPYGLIYDLTKNYMVPVKWVINSAKAKDGTDFSYGGTDFKGGTFIIPAEYRSAAVNTAIASWQAQGVVGVTTTSPITVPVYATLRVAQRWTLDKQNGSIAAKFFVNAGIPSTAHGGSSKNGWTEPADLTCCDDIFVMPHADPIWGTHSRLYTWNLDCKGAIWLGCHAGSALEDMFNPGSPSQQTNFLCEKTTVASGSGPYYENALILWGNHSNGTLPYSYDYPADPVMQFMGILDAATQNGSEQIYLPKSAGWRPTTHVGVYDPDHPQRFSSNLEHRAAIVAYGRGFGDNNRGNVMMEASHDISKSTAPANVAAQRAFFNFSLLTAIERAILPEISGLPANLPAGQGTVITYNLPPGVDSTQYMTQWTSSCGATFTPNATTKTVTLTPPANASECVITVRIQDACGREFFDSKKVTVSCALTVTKTVSNVSCEGGANGAINMTINGASAPYNWNWSRVSPAGTGSGTGTAITGLTAGTYNVTVSSTSGCSASFSSLITQPTTLTATAAPINYQCFGQTGGINLTVNGGTPAYSYNWGGGVTTQNRSGLTAGTYTVTVTDANGCTATASATVTGPLSGMTLNSTMTNVSCNGGTNGSIDITVSGGTSPYSYNWGGGITTEDRTSLTAGVYNVTVTDANGCTATLNKTITQPSALTLSVAATNPTCPPASNPPVNTDGAIDLSVSGGTAPYSYSWSNLPGAPDPQDQTGLAAGTYTVTVTDANGCTATISATLTALNGLPNPPSGINN